VTWGAQGLRRTNKTPVSKTVEGKETWVFEATSTGGPGTAAVKPKGKGGRRKKVEVEETAEVVASSGAPFPNQSDPSQLRL